MQRSLFVFMIAITAALMAGCCSCQKAAEDAPFPRTEIDYSSGGGVAGMSSGYSILPDGTVLRWTGRAGQRQQSERVGKIGDAEMHSLLAELYDLNPESLNHQETGNMTTALQIVSDDMLYTYTWPGTHGDNEAVPASIKPLRDLVWKHIQGALEK